MWVEEGKRNEKNGPLYISNDNKCFYINVRFLLVEELICQLIKLVLCCSLE